MEKSAEKKGEPLVVNANVRSCEFENRSETVCSRLSAIKNSINKDIVEKPLYGHTVSLVQVCSPDGSKGQLIINIEPMTYAQKSETAAPKERPTDQTLQSEKKPQEKPKDLSQTEDKKE